VTRRAVALLAGIGVAVTAGATAIARQPPPAPAPSGRIQADAALVLSGDVDYLRVKRAAALYARGDVKALLLTGRGAGGDSAEEMRKVARAAGVPESAIVLERESTSTRQNLLLAEPVIASRGWKRIALVTSQSHLERALATARKLVPGVDWVPASVPDAGPPSRIQRLRAQEWAKRLWYRARGWS
jgi:uncharacterized SAM-binding protein YcdF (DUF218 family)